MAEIMRILGHTIIFIYLVINPFFMAIEGSAYYFSNNDIWILFLAGFLVGFITLYFIGPMLWVSTASSKKEEKLETT